MFKKMVLVLSCCVLAASVAQADTIAVSNPSFENLTGAGDQGGWTYEGDVEDWSGTLGGVADSHATWSADMQNNHGTWYAAVGSHAWAIGYQELSDTYVAGAEYQLKVAVGRRSDHDGLGVSDTHWGLALGYIEEQSFVALAEIDGTIALNSGQGGIFVDQAVTYTTDAAGLGNNIVIGLINHGGTSNGTYSDPNFSASVFDNVRLEANVIPEPGTLGLLFVGLAALGLIRRR
jgi:hypothetical protein